LEKNTKTETETETWQILFFPSTMYFNASQADRSLVANHSIIVSDFVTKFEEKYLVVDIQKKLRFLIGAFHVRSYKVHDEPSQHF
jgi:hypothetical protein